VQLFENRREVEVQNLIEAGVQAGVEVYQPVAIFRRFRLQIFKSRRKLRDRSMNLLSHVMREEAELASQFVSDASLTLLQ